MCVTYQDALGRKKIAQGTGNVTQHHIPAHATQAGPGTLQRMPVI